MNKKKVGFIGLGTMGKAMATNIARAGFPLTVFDVLKEPLAVMEKLGARVAKSAREVGEESDTVVVMVRDYQQVKDSLFPPDGALGGMRKGTTLIITSTITPQEVVEVENVAYQHGVSVIDSPVSGGRTKAEDASLALMVGGDDAVVKENDDILKAMGSNVFHVGKVGQGQAMKIVNQILVSANIVSVAEAMVMAEKLGINLQTMYDVITRSAGTSEVLQRMGPQMLARDFAPRATVDILIKDTGIIMDSARALEIPLPVFGTVYQIYRMARARGFGPKDATSVFQLLEEFAGL
ncbi:MAG: NAD(P)-dependent oxidoreductase [Dehalococcoidales bacterium]|nr:NAD(P)-dependent oxidoreductase [Dehalococcoidales bacterium]